MTFDAFDYLVDELKLQGLLIRELCKRVYNGCAITDDGKISTTATVFTANDQLFFSGLVEELVARELARERAVVRRGGRITRAAEVDLYTIDGLLESLSKMPTESAMQAILSSRAIRKKAAELDIEQQLIHTGTTRPQYGLAVGETLDMALAEDYSPFLPEPLKTEWVAQIKAIEEAYRSKSLKDMVVEYQDYLNETLDRYAFGSQSQLAYYNTQDGVNGKEMIDGFGRFRDAMHVDDFWRRHAAVVEQPDGTYQIDIVFEPVALKKLSADHVVEVAYVEKNKRWEAAIVSPADPRLWTRGHGRTRMEAIFGLVVTTSPIHFPKRASWGPWGGPWKPGTLGHALGMPKDMSRYQEFAKLAGELTAPAHDPLGVHRIFVTSSDGAIALMKFTHFGPWSERCQLLTGLWKLRNPGLELEKNAEDSDRIRHYTMPYTWVELSNIFGTMET